MEILSLVIPEVKLIRAWRLEDTRGFFSETYKKHVLEEAGIFCDFVQDNQSLFEHRGVVRGLHYQIPPHAQTKLIRVIRGAIFDVAVDIRKSFPTFGKHVTAVISAAEWNQLLVPKGFAHGFCTLEPGTEVFYKVDDYWKPSFERGILWNDPALGIDWPIREGEAILSDRGKVNPKFSDAVELFK